MMKKLFDIFRKIFIGTVFFIIFAPLIISLLYRVVNPSGIERREEHLHRYFQEFEHPAGAKQLKFEITSGIVKRWISAEYKYENMSDVEIEQYYYQKLTQHGWVRKSVNKEADKRFRASTYKKGDYEIYIVPSKNKDSWLIGLYCRDLFERFGT
jgi:hypothetical protein